MNVRERFDSLWLGSSGFVPFIESNIISYALVLQLSHLRYCSCGKKVVFHESWIVTAQPVIPYRD